MQAISSEPIISRYNLVKLNFNGYSILDLREDHAGHEWYDGDNLPAIECAIICDHSSGDYIDFICQIQKI